MNHSEKITALIRLKRESPLWLLDLCLFGLACQTHPDIQVVVVSEAEAARAEVEALLAQQPWRAADWKVVGSGEALTAAQGRYLSVLDPEHLLYQYAYQRLLEAHRQAPAAITVCGYRRTQIEGEGPNVHRRAKHDGWWGLRNKLDLFDRGALLPACLLIDRRQVPDAELTLSDPALVLSLAARFDFNFALIAVPLVECWSTVAPPATRSVSWERGSKITATWEEIESYARSRHADLVAGSDLLRAARSLDQTLGAHPRWRASFFRLLHAFAGFTRRLRRRSVVG